MDFPTPHGDKLHALLLNDRLPSDDRPRVEKAIRTYQRWRRNSERDGDDGDSCIEPLMGLLNRYKEYVDLKLVWDSENDFLYRQKGQLKLDNTVLEEFLPILVGRVFSKQLAERELILGPVKSFSKLSFDSDLVSETPGGGMTLRSKDHDFAMARPLFIKASHTEDFREIREARTHLAYLTAEIKTNLDKTMFQEASGTAYDLKLSLPNSRYFLLCEWLDMTPINTTVTAIEEVIVLRKARRLASQDRRRFATADGRKTYRKEYRSYLMKNPLSTDAIKRFLGHIEAMLGSRNEDEQHALNRGWF